MYKYIAQAIVLAQKMIASRVTDLMSRSHRYLWINFEMDIGEILHPRLSNP